MADGVAADFDTAMIALGGLALVEVMRIGVGKEAFDLGRQRRPVVVERQQIVGALVANGFCDCRLTAHSIDGDEPAGQFEALQQCGDRCDFVGFFLAGLLPEHEPLPARPGRDKVERVLPLAAVVGAAGSLAFDATMSGSPSRKPATQDTKQSENDAAGSALITSLSTSCEGMPSAKGNRRRRKSSLRAAQRWHSTKSCAPAIVAHSTISRISGKRYVTFHA